MDLNNMKEQLWTCLSQHGISGIYLSHNFGNLDPDNNIGTLKLYVVNNHSHGQPICPYALIWTFLYNYQSIPYDVSDKLITLVKYSLHYTDTAILLTNSIFPDKLSGYIHKINSSFADNLDVGMKIIDAKSRIEV